MLEPMIGVEKYDLENLIVIIGIIFGIFGRSLIAKTK